MITAFKREDRCLTASFTATSLPCANSAVSA
eukprot:SAG22_NODE_18491_length_286_cov_1.064171_1_plen_30_part_10